MSKCLYLVLSLIFLFGLNIQKVVATDCDVVATALDYLEPKLKEKYKAENCCDIFKNLGRKFDLICSLQKDILTLGFKDINNPSMDLNAFFEEISKLENLGTLEFKNITGPTGALPSSLGKVKSVRTLYFTDSPSLNLSIPDEIGDLKELQTLNLSNNGIKGEIPSAIGKIESLYSINLSGNSFSGYIPYEFNNLKRLRQLFLSESSDLKGYVPLLPKIETCNYEGTQLCNVSTASCTSNGNTCTNNDIVDTHKNNGNPDTSSNVPVDPKNPPSDGFIGTKSNSGSKKDDDKKGNDSLLYIIAALVALLVILFLINIKFKFIHCHKTETSNETTAATPAVTLPPVYETETTTPAPYQVPPSPYQTTPASYQVPPSSNQVPPSPYQLAPAPPQMNPSAPSGYTAGTEISNISSTFATSTQAMYNNSNIDKYSPTPGVYYNPSIPSNAYLPTNYPANYPNSYVTPSTVTTNQANYPNSYVSPSTVTSNPTNDPSLVVSPPTDIKPPYSEPREPEKK